jgi:hypothetical protein
MSYNMIANGFICGLKRDATNSFKGHGLEYLV